ncbi:MAG: tyrosine-protein phosphatase [Phycisphaerales bacterium]|nr:tyrosine-protein phosphatase [Phycisphaerales bacterium]
MTSLGHAANSRESHVPTAKVAGRTPATSTPRRDAGVAGVLFIVLAVVLGVWFYVDGVRPNLVPKNFGVVEEGKLYRAGELTTAAMRRVVEQHRIRTIVDLGACEPGSREDRRAADVADALGVERYRFHLHGDSTGNPNNYVQALAIMTDPARQPVLVHCGAGSERTGCAVVLYRAAVQRKSVPESYPETFEFKHRDEQNPWLRKTLEAWGIKILRAHAAGVQIPGVEQLAEPAPTGRSGTSAPGRVE